MKRLLLGSIVSALAFAAMMPAQADEITTTTQTIEPPPLSQPQVLDSYMKPVMTQTKSVTTSDGNTQTSTAPMIMERHERVVVPTSEVRTTTTEVAPKVTTEEVTKTETRLATPVKHTVKHRVACHPRKHVAYNPRKHVAYRPRKHVVAYRQETPNRAIAVSQVRKTATVEPQVIQQTQTVEQKGVLIDRRDPALDNN